MVLYSFNSWDIFKAVFLLPLSPNCVTFFSSFFQLLFSANTAKALRGEKRTTRLHRLCSGKIQLRDEWTKDKSIYDKIICGMFTRKDEYKKHEDHVARLLLGQTEKKTLDEQKDELIRAVNRMVHAAGPIPFLRFKGR